MRNLKKILALVLALVMSMSLVTIANADFTDASAISDEEAVTVMSALGIIEGNEDGSFNPEGTLTREQAAKIIAYILLGPTAADKLGGVTAFTDVPATRWSAGYISYCASLDIIAGNGDGTFNPTGKLTGYAFAKMLLTALGYDASIEGYVGAGWQVNVAAKVVKLKLNDGIDTVLSNQLTREEACRMALNALSTMTVGYQNKGTTVTTGDTTVEIGNSAASTTYGSGLLYKTAYDKVVDKWGHDQIGSINNEGEVTAAALTTDDFGRPSREYKINNDTFKFAKESVIVYTAETKESVVDKDLKDYRYKTIATTNAPSTDSVTIHYNGYNSGSVTASVTDAMIAGLTGNGVAVEIYADSNNVITDVVVVYSYLAKVSSVSEKNETITLDFVKDSISNITTETGYGDYEKDAYVMVSPKYSSATAIASGSAADVYAITAATKVTGTISAVEADKSATIDGTTYKKAAIYSQSTFNPTVSNVAIVDAYVDAYGYLVDCNASTAAGNYMYVAKFWDNSYDDYGNQVNKVQGVLTDGTVGTYIVTNGSAAAGLYSYTISDGKYTLTAAEASTSAANYGHKEATVTISSTTVKLNSHYFDKDTNFVVVSGTAGSSLKTTVYTGKQSMAGTVSVYYLTSKSVEDDQSGTITTAFVVGSDVVTTDDDLIYSTSATSNGQVSIDGTTYNTYSLYVNGEKLTVPVKGSTTPAANKFYTYGKDANGVYSLTEKTGGVVNTGVLTTVYGNYITLSATLTGGDYTAADAIIVDTRSGDPDPVLDSLSALQDAVDGGKTVVVSVAYNSEDKVVNAIYVLSGSVSNNTTATTAGDVTVTDSAIACTAANATKANLLAILPAGATATYTTNSDYTTGAASFASIEGNLSAATYYVRVTAENGITTANYTLTVSA